MTNDQERIYGHFVINGKISCSIYFDIINYYKFTGK